MSENRHPWDDRRIGAARRRLLAFFDERQRDLPWRGEPDPYRIWVSEIMLQQTRVETVVPYYRRWMERFPNLEALAGATGDEVLQLWQGLGYYSRARNLHRAAREVHHEYGGRLPDTAVGLKELPGIGDYTAGAVASIAFDRAEPAVDGNVRRVLARLMDVESPRPATLREWARGLVSPERPGDFNQALMELGALICTPRSPACGQCPLAEFCAARAAGTQEERPARKRRGPVPRVSEVALVLERGDPRAPEFLLRKRPDDGLLGGMWECPTAGFDGDPSNGDAISDALSALASRVVGTQIADRVALPPVDHVFSHRRIRYLPHWARVHPDGAEPAPAPLCRWVALGDRHEVALPVAQQSILNEVERLVSADASRSDPA